jgi:hypothetical protein
MLYNVPKMGRWPQFGLTYGEQSKSHVKAADVAVD